MKKNYYFYILILLTFISIFYIFNYTSDKISVLCTNYDLETSAIYNFKNGKSKNHKDYSIGNINGLFNSDNKYILFDTYGTKLLVDNKVNINEYSVKYNPVQIYEYNKLNYILHNDTINKFSITTYDSNFIVKLNSYIFEGFAQNFFIKDNFIYIISNVYNDNLERTVKLYILDSNTLNFINSIDIQDMTFAFYMNFNNDKIYIYGNQSEEKLNLSLCVYNLKDSIQNTTIYDKKAMWVKNVLFINDYIYILNDFSIIILDKNFNIKKEFSIDNYIFIDFYYNKSISQFVVLTGNYSSDEYKIIKLNNDLNIQDSFSINTDSKIPIKLIKE